MMIHWTLVCLITLIAVLLTAKVTNWLHAQQAHHVTYTVDYGDAGGGCVVFVAVVGLLLLLAVR